MAFQKKNKDNFKSECYSEYNIPEDCSLSEEYKRWLPTEIYRVYKNLQIIYKLSNETGLLYFLSPKKKPHSNRFRFLSTAPWELCLFVEGRNRPARVDYDFASLKIN